MLFAYSQINHVPERSLLPMKTPNWSFAALISPFYNREKFDLDSIVIVIQLIPNQMHTSMPIQFSLFQGATILRAKDMSLSPASHD